jgi:Domain of unknown function (DUF4112)
MDTVTVNVNRAGEGQSRSPRAAANVPTQAELEIDLARARKLARLMDSQFSIAGIEFGLDAIVGLIPVAGDCLTAAVSLYPIYLARRHNLGRTVQLRMGFNVLMDTLPGLIPVVGDVIDVAYKANLKNLKLLERAVEKRRGKPGEQTVVG